ncbi:prephenate dehydrogenase/arogenate dehydrogenase family protein [uncultured Muribaculum sp.]|uniref:prephenate dehydrogenase/arogenate dehydrogenase family protein n=1 Tax=uncultured Muribaculum sp. TaxID=1918613 RepID=UPI0025B74B60|nr:prephenate dehydrogenase/arogenate dehydrogenase family protein [uncultured Muribaculum sp.]
MKILILGAGKMGSFFCDLLSTQHDLGVYDPDPKRLLFTFNCRRFASLDEVRGFEPEMVINAATVKYTLQAFNETLPYLPQRCILSDIASVKTGLPEFYASCGHPFVSTHPMFGPTFASLSNLQNENAIIIAESDCLGKAFFRDLYRQLRLHIEEYTFAEHDSTIAYSLSIPFASTLVFAGCMKHQDAPGTTFKRHKAIADGLMSEDDFLLSEILFNPNTPEQLQRIAGKLSELLDIVKRRDSEAMKKFLDGVRQNLK